MNMHQLSWHIGRGVTAAAAAMLLALGMSGTVHANTSQGLIYGAGTVTDDWGDEGPLSTTSYAYSDAVSLWQGVLYADGYLANWSDIDCRFGPATQSATIAWQKNHGLTADGIVGPNTFGKADDKLTISGTGTGNVVYHGSAANVPMTRDSSGKYGWGDGVHYYYYNKADMSACQ